MFYFSKLDCIFVCLNKAKTENKSNAQVKNYTHVNKNTDVLKALVWL